MSAQPGQTRTTPIHGDGRYMMPPPGSRSAEQIRRDIVTQRQQLSRSVDALRTRWGEITNLRRQVSEHRTELLVGAAAVGFLLGGAIALGRRRR
jgi:type VI protein secretion system component VasF